jgi:hypothetical protein
LPRFDCTYEASFTHSAFTCGRCSYKQGVHRSRRRTSCPEPVHHAIANHGDHAVLLACMFCSAGISCFSAATRVVVRGAEQPVAMRDLRVGQAVLCFDSGPDMHAPGAPAWCEVKNFVSGPASSDTGMMYGRTPSDPALPTVCWLAYQPVARPVANLVSRKSPPPLLSRCLPGCLLLATL